MTAAIHSMFHAAANKAATHMHSAEAASRMHTAASHAHAAAAHMHTAATHVHAAPPAVATTTTTTTARLRVGCKQATSERGGYQ
jgi:hypothetical protein